MENLEAQLIARSAMRPDMWADIAGVPVRQQWPALREKFIRAVSTAFSGWIDPSQSHFSEQLLFATGRFDEGAALVRYLALNNPQWGTVLDIGAGNGGVAFALANCQQNKVYTLDIVPNYMIRVLRESLAIPLHALVATGALIPVQGDSVEVVLLLDTLEHLPEPKKVGAEIMRVLRPGGICIITTPARVRHLLGRDPHYGVRYLALLPNEVQRFIVNRVFRRRTVDDEGRQNNAYDVEHLFWHVDEVARLFPGPKTVDVLFNRTYRPPGRFKPLWIRHPHLAREWFLYAVRGFFYDTIVVRKN